MTSYPCCFLYVFLPPSRSPRHHRSWQTCTAHGGCNTSHISHHTSHQTLHINNFTSHVGTLYLSSPHLSSPTGRVVAVECEAQLRCAAAAGFEPRHLLAVRRPASPLH